MEDVLSHIKNMEDWQKQHGIEDQMIHAQTVDRLNVIDTSLSVIRDNHLAHLQLSYEQIARDLWWVKWLCMGLVSGIGAIVVGVLIGIATRFT